MRDALVFIGAPVFMVSLAGLLIGAIIAGFWVGIKYIFKPDKDGE